VLGGDPTVACTNRQAAPLRQPLAEAQGGPRGWHLTAAIPPLTLISADPWADQDLTANRWLYDLLHQRHKRLLAPPRRSVSSSRIGIVRSGYTPSG